MAAAILHSFSSSKNYNLYQSIVPNKLRNPFEQPRHLITQPTMSSLKTLRAKQQNASLAHSLFSYMESGRMDEALVLFTSAKKPDAFLWNVMIRGYTNQELYVEAIEFYHRMLLLGLRPDNFTFPFAIKSCTALLLHIEGVKIHARLIKTGLDSDLFICNSLIVFYSKHGLMESAERMFTDMPMRDVVSWNGLIDGYVTNGRSWRALWCLREMQIDYVMKPDKFGIMSALEACSLDAAQKQGKEIHCYVMRHGLELEIKVQTSLLNMHCKCGNILYAERFFTLLPQRNIVAWNAMIGGYALHGRPYDAFGCVLKMQADGVDPDAITMVNLLPASAHLRSISFGKTIHAYVIRSCFLPHFVLEGALVDMYAKCGQLKPAELLFDRLSERSLVTWNSMITAYVQCDWHHEAIELFVVLLEEPLEPDMFTISSIIPAYAELASLRHGMQIHSHAIRSGYVSDVFILNSIVYMYARCGDLQTSRRVFDGMPSKNIVSWNSLILGYGIHGHGKIALDLLSDMQATGLQPNESTFVSVLTACSTSGLVDEGWTHFNSMRQDYGIVPQIEHYGCIVDLLGRSGDLEQALKFIERMPLIPTARIWGSLLTASRNSNNIEVAEFAAERILAMENDNTGCYVLLSSMYADAGRWEDVERVSNLMRKESLQRTTASSLVEVGSKTCSFSNGDRHHLESSRIHEVSHILSQKIGDAYNSANIFKPVELLAKKESSPNKHCVRLAVSFGLISVEVGSPILIKKNVRVCNTCHQAIKKISKYSRRKITVGDSKMYHHFRDGLCCCGDYW